MPNRPSPSEPLVMGRFQVLKVLDHGPASFLYLAQDPARKSLVLLKTATPGRVAPELAEQYEQTLKVTCLLDHPGVHGLQELDQDPAFGPYLVLDYVEGTSLASLLAANLPAFPALHLLIQVAQVLEFAAQKGISHGDLQPHAVWVTPKGEARLHGFATQGRLKVGSGSYAAPERQGAGIPTARADQFSLAATAFHLLFGKPPFPGATEEETLLAVREGEFSLPAKTPVMLQKVFLKALDKDPNGRYASLRDFMAVLIAAAPLEEHHQEDLLSFLDGTPLAFEGGEFLSRSEPPRAEPPPAKSDPAVQKEPLVPAVAGKAPLGSWLLQEPGISGFATFGEGGALLASSPQSGDLVDLAPTVYFNLADAAFGTAGESPVRHFLFRARNGIRYVLHRRVNTLCVIKLKPEANLQEILRGLDTGRA